MDKQRLLSVYCQTRPKNSSIAGMCDKYPELLNDKPLAPEFLTERTRHSESSNKNEVSDNSSSINQTVSFCSNFSRVTVDKVVFRDILKKRKDHPLFLELESPESHGERKWYYLDDKDGSIVGPLNAEEMNKRFELEVFNERTKLKRKFEEEYYPLSVLIKRYYKNVLSEKLDLQKEPGQLPNKIAKFKKGEAPTRKFKEKETFEPKNREERFYSHVMRPVLDLNKMVAGEFDGENDLQGRIRANTHEVSNTNKELAKFYQNDEEVQGRIRSNTDTKNIN